jgi:hypothetical protein
MQSIDRRHQLTAAELDEEYVKPALPVVVTGIVDQWPAFRAWWPPKALGERGGSALVPLITLSEGPYRYYRQSSQSDAPSVLLPAVPTPFSECIERIFSSQGCYYLHQVPLLDAMPQLEQDFSHPYPELDESGDPVVFWIGSRGSISRLHFDLGHNFLCVLSGKKRFLIYSRQQGHRLYPSADGKHSDLSAAEPVDPDRFPLFARAEPIELWLEPGELLFLPSLWWHQVITEESSVMLTWFWHTREMLRDRARLGTCKAALDAANYDLALAMIEKFETSAYRNVLHAATVRLALQSGATGAAEQARARLADPSYVEALRDLV